MARSTFEEINIGPFVGGLNTLSDQSSISDTELIEMVNFECDKDGSLVSRPPIFKASPEGAIHASVGGLKIIGYFVDAASGAYYLIGSNRVSRTAYYASGAWTTITDTFAATACVQFRDSLHLLAPLSSANPGGTWTPSGGFTAVPTMPKGAAIVANKERLWIAQGKDAPTNGSRVYVSDISSGSLVWDGDFINIQQGDGQNIVDLAIVYSDLIVFKQRSTYRFAFDADIASGQVTRLSDNIGASDTGCFASLEDRLFVLFDNVVYDFTSYRFTRLNTTVPLKSDVASGSLSEVRGISVWADRLFVNYFGRTLVYNLITRVWCEWRSPNRVGSLGRLYPFPVQTGTSQQAYLYSVEPLGGEKGRTLYRISDQFDSTGTDEYTTENYSCTFETKNYDYKSPSKFKRLGLWGADILSRTNIDVQAKPVTYGRPVTWDQLKNGPGGPGASGYDLIKLKNIDEALSMDSGVSPLTAKSTAFTVVPSTWPTGILRGSGCLQVSLAWGGLTPSGYTFIGYQLPTKPAPGKWIGVHIPLRYSAGSRYYTARVIFYQGSTDVGNARSDTVYIAGGLYSSSQCARLVAQVPNVTFDRAIVYLYANDSSSGLGGAPPVEGTTFFTDEWRISINDTQAEALAQVAPYVDTTSDRIYRKQGNDALLLTPVSRPEGYSWDSIPGSWDRPIDLSYIISDNVAVEDISEGRKWVKFLKSLRFRQISFRASANTDGTSRTAPIRVFSLTTYVKEKQLVPRKIN